MCGLKQRTLLPAGRACDWPKWCLFYSLHNVGASWSCRHSVRFPREKYAPNPYHLSVQGLDGCTALLFRQSRATLPCCLRARPFARWLSCTWTLLAFPKATLTKNSTSTVAVLCSEVCCSRDRVFRSTREDVFDDVVRSVVLLKSISRWRRGSSDKFWKGSLRRHVIT